MILVTFIKMCSNRSYS